MNETAPRILVVEDDLTLNRLICSELEKAGYAVNGVHGCAAAEAHLASREPALIIIDVRLPDGDGLELLAKHAASHPVIVITAFGSVRDAVDAIKRGASDYLLKPVSLDELLFTVGRVLDTARLRQQNQFLRRRLEVLDADRSRLLGHSAAMVELRRAIEMIAPADMPVLIRGENGSGRSSVARAIHAASNRTQQAFVSIHCCAFEGDALASELFGHEHGALPGADRHRNGLVEAVDGGTLYLDEITEIDPANQARLARLIETGQFRRLGGSKDLNGNVRMVASTAHSLDQVLAQGSLRHDFYYRANGFELRVPPLRERREDIHVLAEHFVRKFCFSRREDKRISKAAVRRMIAYDWPGNVREMENLVERAVILSRDSATIEPEHLVFQSTDGPGDAVVSLSFDHDPTLDELFSTYLAMQLKKFSGRRADVAESLGISERSVYRMIKRFDLGND